MKERIEKWYKQGLWTEEMVRNAWVKGVLSETEYLKIVQGD